MTGRNSKAIARDHDYKEAFDIAESRLERKAQ